ncbi:MAG: hypothetical protein WAR57_08875 [Candidatus Phosphoribacter sp.]
MKQALGVGVVVRCGFSGLDGEQAPQDYQGRTPGVLGSVGGAGCPGGQRLDV